MKKQLPRRQAHVEGTVADEGDRAHRDSCHEGRHTIIASVSRHNGQDSQQSLRVGTGHTQTTSSPTRVTHITISRSESGSHMGHQPLHTRKTHSRRHQCSSEPSPTHPAVVIHTPHKVPCKAVSMLRPAAAHSLAPAHAGTKFEIITEVANFDPLIGFVQRVG